MKPRTESTRPPALSSSAGRLFVPTHGLTLGLATLRLLVTLGAENVT